MHMRYTNHALIRRGLSGVLASMGLAAVLVLAACGGSSGPGSGGLYGASGGGSSATSAPTTAPSGAAVVTTATATVDGKSETILTSAQGRTLYYFTPDTAQTSACSGTCAQMWPPLLASSASGTPAHSGSISGTLTVVSDANGAQVEYNGHPLYTFSGDKASGDTKGQGLFGKWFAATPALAAGTSGGSSGGASPTATPGY